MRPGAPTTTVFLPCPKCDRQESIPPGMMLRIPGVAPRGYCHEVFDPATGIVHKRG